MTTPRAVLADDTAAWAEAMQVEHWRRQAPLQRFERLRQDIATARFLARGGARICRPAATEAELDRHVASAWLGEPPPTDTRPAMLTIEGVVMIDPDPYDVAASVSEALEALGVGHVVVGSLASIAFGEPRLTRDGDIVADLRTHHVLGFTRALADTFFIDEQAVWNAVRARGHFNILHRASMFKIDLFVDVRSAYQRGTVRRALPIERGGHRLPVATPEDSLLGKLVWYRKGNEVSSQQWRDVLGILLVQAGALDDAYLDRWAGELGVDDLLAKARAAVLRGDDAMSGVG